MLIIFLVIFLAVFFFVNGFILRNYPNAERTKRATKPLSLMIDLSPVAGIIVFTVLFTCALKGRLPERLSHAVLVFTIWMCATKFYCYLLAHYNLKRAVISCAAGMLFSIGLAVFLTPLDRYVATVYEFTGWYSIFFGCGLLAVFYAVTVVSAVGCFKRKNARQCGLRAALREGNMNIFNFNAVGQGLFYTGSLMHGTYNFVFDCGTENKKQYIENNIDRFIGSIGDGKTLPDIEFVVISHLHIDHFSGLQYLLNKSNVKRLYLPYLGEDRLVKICSLALSILSRALGNDDGTREENYFIEQFAFMCELYGVGGEYNDISRYSRSVVFITKEGKRKTLDDGRYYFRKDFTAGANNDYWRFVLLESGVDGEDLKLLKKRLEKAFGDLSVYDVIEAFKKDKNVIFEFKKIYESVFGEGNDLNLTSILLLHEPLYKSPVAVRHDNSAAEYNLMHYAYDRRANFYEPCYYCYNNLLTSVAGATLLTGDALIDGCLADEIRLSLGKGSIYCLQVPHHGSENNWQAIVNHKISAQIYVIPFGYGNRHKLPHVSTVDYFEEKNLTYYCATQEKQFVYLID